MDELRGSVCDVQPVLFSSYIFKGAMVGLLLIGRALSSDVKIPDFTRDVRPVLAAKCYPCHGPDGEARKAGLRLDRFETATLRLKSGRSAISPKNRGESEILKRVVNPDPELHMPPRGEPLTSEEVDTLTRWIESGAVYSEPWAFRSLSDAPLPAVSNLDWCFGGIDQFVLASRESRGWAAPSRDVDSSGILRRLSFDLRGLPPEAADLSEMREEGEGDRYTRLVDRYLADPAFGERWGRHWLDLARYAESLGHEFDFDIPYAWRYRDYVIDALNTDLAPSRFVSEQIAGDLLTPRAGMGLPNAAPLGTAWWFLGPATHAPVDVRQDEADRTAGAVDVVGRTFFGLSIACARCHDHKFDPIPTRDFYSLAGVIRNTRRIEGFLDTDPDAVGYAGVASRALSAASVAGGVVPRASMIADRAAGVEVIDAAANGGAEWSRSGHAFDTSGVGFRLASDGTLRTAESGTLDSSRLSHRLTGSARSRDFTVSKRYLHLRLRGSEAAFRLSIDNYWLDGRVSLLFEGFRRKLARADGVGATGDPRNVAWKLETFDLARYQGERVHIEVLDEGEGWIEVDTVLASDSATVPDAGGWDTDGPFEASITSGATVEQARLSAVEARRALLECKPAIRALVADEGGALDEPVHLRGSSRKYGEPSPRARLSILGTPPVEKVSGSGRLALIASLTDPARPFLWRTTANRVWLKLFGRGIVETPDDFGQLGATPWSAELLDYLAGKLASGVTFKQLIREIVLSHAYRAAPEIGEDLSMAWGPVPVRRLDAEVIRDTLLSSARVLDRKAGGVGVQARLTEHMQGRGRPGTSGPVDGAGRRSVYLESRRNFLDPFLQAFDQPPPSTTCGRRHASNVPAQALAFLNSELVHLLAGRWAEAMVPEGSVARVSDVGVDRSLIGQLWLTAYSRSPRDTELEAALDFLAAERAVADVGLTPLQRDRRAYTALNHTLFASKEFVFLR